MRILITDDHTLFRQGLRRLLNEAFPNAEFGEAGNATEAHELVTKKKWDVVIVDITMPGRSGLELVKDLKAIRPKLPILILSMHTEEQFAVRLLRAGAAGYLKKDCAATELIAAVRKVATGGRYVTAALAEKLAIDLQSGGPQPRHEQLSDREFAVLRLIGAGKTAKEIAAELSLSVSTVSTYRTRLLGKMNLRNNAELMRYAVDRQLV